MYSFTVSCNSMLKFFTSAYQNRLLYCQKASNSVIMQLMRNCASFVQHTLYYVEQQCERQSNLQCLFLALVVFSHNALLIERGVNVSAVPMQLCTAWGLELSVVKSTLLSVNNAEFNCIIKCQSGLIQHKMNVIIIMQLKFKTYYSSLLKTAICSFVDSRLLFCILFSATIRNKNKESTQL